ncbi:MAG: leucine-rich repeat domain-containing protein, partial [Muribaculaceae bacterium]|nr:leucine-rich repeat domain-containing protein [Muribaculaceae bacterium]
DAFEGCGIKSINIPESIKSIGQSAFFDCKNLQKVEFASIESLLTIDYENYSANPLNAFLLDYESESIKYTNAQLYIGGKEISEVIIPNTMTEIKPYSLSIRNINTVIIPESVKKIEHGAFCGSGINSINIPESIKNIGQGAFAYCDNLQKVEFSSIESICSMHYDYPDRDPESEGSVSNPLYYANHLFIDGIEITDLYIPETVIQICPFALYGCKVLSSVNIPNSVIKIGEGAFGYCDGLSSVTIPESVKLIADYAFTECKNLSSVIISDTIEKIGECAFEGCINLLSVTIPKSIKSIGYLAFNRCERLEKIFYNTLNPISISKNYEIFNDETFIYATLYVPAESLLKFDNVSPWRYFKHIEVDNSMSSVENSIEENIEYKVYTPDGQCIRSSLEELPEGLYIIRDNKNRSKIKVKR